jgi:hypothetical protein
MDNVNTILRIAAAVPQRKSNALVTFTWPESPLPVPERLFIRAQMKWLSAAMCVCNPDRSPVGINR